MKYSYTFPATELHEYTVEVIFVDTQTVRTLILNTIV